MKTANLLQSASPFRILQTTPRSQTAVMTLQAGEASSEGPSAHSESDQVLLVLEGELVAEIGSAQAVLRKGDSVTVPAATPHKFSNKGQERVVTFNVYAPPAYGSHKAT